MMRAGNCGNEVDVAVLYWHPEEQMDWWNTQHRKEMAVQKAKCTLPDLTTNQKNMQTPTNVRQGDLVIGYNGKLPIGNYARW